MDCLFPGMQTTYRNRQLDPHDPKFILISGYSDTSEADCIAKGVHKVFTKPYDRKDLMDTVFEALGLSKEDSNSGLP